MTPDPVLRADFIRCIKICTGATRDDAENAFDLNWAYVETLPFHQSIDIYNEAIKQHYFALSLYVNGTGGMLKKDWKYRVVLELSLINLGYDGRIFQGKHHD